MMQREFLLPSLLVFLRQSTNVRASLSREASTAQPATGRDPPITGLN